MMGMGFLKLNKMLARHKWKKKQSEETIEKQRSFEDFLLYGSLALVLGLIVLAIFVS